MEGPIHLPSLLVTRDEGRARWLLRYTTPAMRFASAAVVRVGCGSFWVGFLGSTADFSPSLGRKREQQPTWPGFGRWPFFPLGCCCCCGCLLGRWCVVYCTCVRVRVCPCPCVWALFWRASALQASFLLPNAWARPPRKADSGLRIPFSLCGCLA